MKFLLFLCLTLHQLTVQAQISPISSGDPIQADKINSMIVEINKMYDIGDIRSSLLTEEQFQSRNGSCWVLMNGQSVSGSLYESLTGRSSLPSAAGRFLRNAGGSAAALASTQEDEFASHTHIQDAHTHIQNAHTHTVQIPNTSYSLNISSAVNNGTGTTVNTSLQNVSGINNETVATNQNTIATNQNTGGIETRPKNLTVNMFVKINNCN